ncbi:ABC transporter [Carnobacterium iners]|nr:ABC transporter [Carnobacterium iners]
MVAIIGSLDAGKSTLLRCLNLLGIPTSGEITFEQNILAALIENKVNNLREKIEMVFQSFNLFPNLSVAENLKITLIKVVRINEKEA